MCFRNTDIVFLTQLYQRGVLKLAFCNFIKYFINQLSICVKFPHLPSTNNLIYQFSFSQNQIWCKKVILPILNKCRLCISVLDCIIQQNFLSWNILILFVPNNRFSNRFNIFLDFTAVVLCVNTRQNLLSKRGWLLRYFACKVDRKLCHNQIWAL